MNHAIDAAPRARKRRQSRIGLSQNEMRKVDDLSSRPSMIEISKASCTTSSSRASISRQTNRMTRDGRYRELMLSSLDRGEIPSALLSLLQRSRSAADGKATLPTQFLQQLSKYANEDIDLHDEHLRTSEDLVLSWREVMAIVNGTQWCKLRKDYETGWNSCVHGPMLSLACSLAGKNNAVRFVSLANVRPKAYLLRDKRDVRKKMVDFGLVLHLEDSASLMQFYYHQDFPGFLDGDDFKAWNHSASQQIAQTPLAISIETKRHEEEVEEAELQLGTWATAHLRRLVELRRDLPNVSAPPRESIFLPQIKIKGASWTLMLIRGDFEPAAADVYDSMHITLYTGFVLGDVSTYSGFFRVLKCLMLLIRWIDEEYRPWLHRWVGLDPE